ncbi:MAG: molybdenum cofactor biosynthesis protein MoaE [Thermoprotei archaeon]|nr:MAG: molybdenum cofactor biosynthesis protein MoaE [Thermoprotei archaeon]
MDVKTGVIRGSLSLDKIVEEVTRVSVELGGGAVVCFVGFVKGLVDDKKVFRLDYTAYEPYASRKLEEIAREEAARYKLLAVRVYHRIGELKPGEPTIYIVVVSRSREEAFEGARSILERVKREAPIFKLERREDGDYWIIGDRGRVKRSR